MNMDAGGVSVETTDPRESPPRGSEAAYALALAVGRASDDCDGHRQRLASAQDLEL
jgi:hypothetical protein